MIGNEDRSFWLDGNDITDRILTFATVPLVKNQWGQIPASAPITLTARTDDFGLTPWHPVSLVYGLRLDDLVLEIRQGGVTRWKGVTSAIDVEPGGQRCSIQGETMLTSRLTRNGRVDTDSLSPSQAIARLLALHGIDTDAESFARAANILDDIPVTVRVRPDPLTWDGTLGDLLQQLASAGVCRVYVRPDGVVGVDTWVPPESSVVTALTLTDDDLMAAPDTTREEADPADGFSVQYLFGTSTDTDSSDVVSLDFGPNATVQIETEVGAVYVGSQWRELQNRRRTVLGVAVARDVGISLMDERFIRVQSTRLAIDFTGEVVGWDDSDPRWVKLTLHVDDRMPRGT